jgi:flagellar assembly protein FliH
MTNSSKQPRPAPPPGNTAAAGSKTPYARFIPREELNGFASWTPGAISGAGETTSGVHRAEPPPPPAAPTPSPEQLLAEHVRQARTGGYQDGYRDGLVALEGFKQSFATQMTAQLGMLSESYMQQLDALQQQMARALAVSATQLARQMVRNELSTRPDLITKVAEEAIDALLLSARHITVHVHPDDHPLVAQGAAETLAARGARLMSDASIERGGCLVESDIGGVDASLDTRWRRASASLGIDQGWDGRSAEEIEAEQDAAEAAAQAEEDKK